MTTVYRLNETELDERFLDALRALFRGKDLEITVSEADETSYLLSSDANRERLLRSIENIEAQCELVEIAADMLR